MIRCLIPTQEPAIDAVYNQTITDSQLTALGIDQIFSFEVARLTGGASDNTLDASSFSGKANLWGADGNDVLIASATTGSKLNGGGGDDTLSGGDGNDHLRGGNGNDGIAGHDGNDRIYGNSGDDTVLGQNGVDSIYGQARDDIALGGWGNDRVNGGVGLDTVAGGPGFDTLIDAIEEIDEAFTFVDDWVDLV